MTSSTRPVSAPPFAPPEPDLGPEELVARAISLRPKLIAEQAETEARTYHSEGLYRDFVEAGFYRMYVPRRYGGYEFDVPTFMRVTLELSRGCVSTGWCVALAAAAEVASTVGLGDVLDRPAASLTVAGRKRLEVARALAAEPELLLLDEVLAGLNPAEVATMVPIIRGLADSGVTILMIEHVMQAVMRLAEHVFVLAEGRIIAAGAPQEAVDNPRVVEAYLGHGAAARLSAAGAAHV